MKYLVWFLRIFVGGLFIFSGFIKAVDPVGTAYKMMEYFEEFKMLFMEPFTNSFSVTMVVLEIVLGVALLIGWRKKLTLGLLLITIIFFTFLTGYTAMTGHVTDCGCFGDFLKLKPIVSFKKDLVLLVSIVLLIIGHKHIKPLLSDYISNSIVGIATVASVIFCFSNFIWNEPVFDFRPYKVGTFMPEKMVIKPGEEQKSVAIFTYKDTVTGEVKKLINSSPDGDHWKFISRVDSVTKEGMTQPPIKDFQIEGENDYMTDSILQNKDYNFMVVAWELKSTDKKAFEKLNAIYAGAAKDGKKMCAISKDRDKFPAFKQEVHADYPFYFIDGTPAKTIMRSNPGLVLLKNGTILAKWHKNKLPTYEEIKAQYFK